MPDATAPVQSRAARAALLDGRLLPAVLIIVAGLLVYTAAFGGVFLLDDLDSIVGAPEIRQGFRPGLLFIGSRPLVQATLTLNYALGGLNPWGYHLFNIAVHILAALVLFAVLRRLFRKTPLAETFGPAAGGLALAAALLWLVHPLQTGAVTYLVQRAESIVGLCFLLTLYAAIRSLDARQSGLTAAARRWAVAAVAACLAGAATKPVIASAPILVLLYDRTFVSGAFLPALRRSWGLYAGLALSWIAVAGLTLAYPDPVSAGFSVPRFTPWQYALTQCAVLTHYLALALWPARLCLDYSWPPATSLAQVWPQALLLIALIGGTLWLTWRRSPLGFAGMWFFLILAPTSSFVPLADACFEHRMYLSLAALITLGVALAWRLITLGVDRLSTEDERSRRRRRTVALMLFALVFLPLSLRTHLRNQDYRSEVDIWRDATRNSPLNARAHCHLGTALARQRDLSGAEAEYREALRLDPRMPRALYNLGTALALRGDYAGAADLFEQTVRLNPLFAPAHQNLGAALARLGKTEQAVAAYRESLRLMPASPAAHRRLADALARLGKTAEAETEYQAASDLERRRSPME